MKVILRPTRPRCFSWRILLGLPVIVGLLLAQQPVNVANTPLAVSQNGTWTVQPGNTANTTPWLMTINQGGNSATVTAANALKVDGSAVTQPVSFAPGTGSGVATTTFHGISSTSTFNTVKGTAGNLYGLYTFNPNSAPCYVVFYNSAAPTVGTTAIVESFEVQAGLAAQIPVGPIALTNFATAITFATTTTDGGSTLCTTGMSTNVWYQ